MHILVPIFPQFPRGITQEPSTAPKSSPFQGHRGSLTCLAGQWQGQDPHVAEVHASVHAYLLDVYDTYIHDTL